MLKSWKQILSITMVFGMLLSLGANADAMMKKIVLFQENISSDEIDSYLAQWEAAGAIILELLPFINGAILAVPDTITSSELADDQRVAGVENDQRVALSAIVAAGDGAAGDGAAGDGAAGDGAAGDGAAGDGAADVPPPDPIRFIQPTDRNPFNGERPWGILHLYEQPYEPGHMSSIYDNEAVPAIIRDAMDRSYLKKIKIAVFDTGADYTHPRLDNHIEGGIDFVNMTQGVPADDNGHGTHVAATVVARRVGLARGSKLFVVKILDENAMGEVSTLVVALEWAIENGMDIVNMSVAFREDNSAVRMAIQKAYEAGIIMVAAVGNHSNWEDDEQASGDGAAGDGAAGDGAAGDGAAGDGAAGDGAASGDGTTENPYPVMYPAAYPEVIAVGAHTSFGDVTRFSNSGPELDLYAPGKKIASANLMELSKYGICNGTSMATPLVSGTIALMLSLDHNNVLTCPDDIRDILVSTSVDGKLSLVGALEEVRNRQ